MLRCENSMYAGLRLDELRALRDEDVDLKAGVVRVERSWDKAEGVIDPKSRAGQRKVPIVAELRTHLAAHRLRRPAGELFFGDGGIPFNRDALVARAVKAWRSVNVKALSSYLAHASITITLDRYGHTLMPGNEDEAVQLVDAYVARQSQTRTVEPQAA